MMVSLFVSRKQHMQSMPEEELLEKEVALGAEVERLNTFTVATPARLFSDSPASADFSTLLRLFTEGTVATH
jgi:hypothetical protein